MAFTVSIAWLSLTVAAGAQGIVHFDLSKYKRIGERGTPSLAAIDADSDLDLTHCRRQSVEVIFNVRSGFFPSGGSRLTPVGGDCLELTTLDFNFDDVTDLAVSVESQEASLLLLRGNGDGTFDALDRYSLEDTGEDIGTGDFDLDGQPDLVVSEPEANQVEVLTGQGDGEFSPPTDREVGRAPQALDVEDLNSDGTSDVVTANMGTDDLSVLLGRAGGGLMTLDSRARRVNGAVDLALADFGSDGITDVAALSRKARGIKVFDGNGDGTFERARTLLETGRDPAALVAADFNADSRADLAATWEPNLGVYLSRGAERFSAPTAYSLSGPSGRTAFRTGNAFAAGPINGDPLADIIVPGESLRRFLATDRLYECRGKTANFVGSSVNDVFETIADGRRMVAQTGSGDDLAEGGQKDDIACLGGGDDQFSGDRGKDRIYAGAGSDRHVHGNLGGDLLNGGAGDDVLGSHRYEPEPGHDKLLGGPGRDLLNGGLGKDDCNGGSQRDGAVSCERRRRFP